jgi:small acid-soluble spore protein D (minor alpha/beta-type SASP)
MATERKEPFSRRKAAIFPGKRSKERRNMKSNNQINVPAAKEAMDKFKMQAASEVGVNLTNGYNGHLTSREAGSVGGQMVKKMIEAYEQGLQ